MSSKVVKGGVPSAGEMQWRSVGAPRPGALHDFAPPLGVASNVAVADSGPHDEQADELARQLQVCREQSEATAKDALQKGIQQGEANARQQLTAQSDALFVRLGRTIEEITGMRQRCRYAAEQDVVKLALAIARRVIHRELTVDPSVIVGLVKAALQSIDLRELHRIRVHPTHVDPLRRQLEAMGLPQRCEVLGDPALEKGAAVLETGHGTLDASVGTQLEEIERGFADLVKHVI